jgi:hypothetical protein
MNQNQEVTIETLDTLSVYQSDKAQIDVQISTAKAFPRNIKRATENALAVVTMDIETASTCTYALPRGGKPISGPSVHLAKILSQTWGNLRVEAKVIAIEPKQVVSQAVAFDLENNLAVKVEVRRSIMTKNGRMSDDMITVTGNAANSIALRNAVLSVIPKAVVDKVYKAAQQTITGDISDETKFIARRKKVIDGFIQTYGVTEKEILFIIGKNAIEHITSDNLVVLIGVAQSLKDGDTTVDEVFKKNQISETKPKAEIEEERLISLINTSTSIRDLQSVVKGQKLTEKANDLFNQKMQELDGKAN